VGLSVVAYFMTATWDFLSQFWPALHLLAYEEEDGLGLVAI
jgi:hypothetical protein